MQHIMRTGRFVGVRLGLIALYLKPDCEKKELIEISDAILQEIENYLAQLEGPKGKGHSHAHDGRFSYKARQEDDEEVMNDYK